jgi:pimeloyl-ACP methyl ester carboxylesterase
VNRAGVRTVSGLVAALTMVVAVCSTTPASARATSASGGPASGGATSPSATLTWAGCRGDLECATLAVPAVYDDPARGTIDVAVARVRARNPTERIGVLVVNPGGPGVGAVDRLAGVAASMADDVKDRFDIVAYDPRGTGATTPIDCASSLDPVFDASFSPTSDAQRATLLDALRSVAASCAQRQGDLLDEVSTLESARDMDQLRVALGEAQLNYLGFSYGTYLGSLYASLFPGRARALVLDGAVDPSADGQESTLSQARGFEANLDAFLRHCAHDADCAFHRDGRPGRAYDALRRQIVAAPVPASGFGERRLNDTRFDAAVLQLLYQGQASWDQLAAALDAASDGDAATLLAIADQFVGRRRGGGDDHSVEAFWAIGCLDGPALGDANAMGELDATARRVAPRVGAFVVNFSLACAVWPTSPASTMPTIDDAAPDALVIGTRADPATPLVSARRLARLLGGAALVVVGGDRHTAVGSGNPCVDDAVRDYLVTAKVTRPVTRC